MTKYKITLTPDERLHLRSLIASGKAAAKKLVHARVLLKADAAEGGPAWSDDAIAEAVEVHRDTVTRIRQRFVEGGLDAALVRKPQTRPSRARGLDGRAEAKRTVLACSAPPDGRAAWTMQRLADKLVAWEVVAAVSDETVRRTLKKTNSSRGGRSSGACRRSRTPHSTARWRTSWMFTTGLRTRSVPWSAWTRRASR